MNIEAVLHDVRKASSRLALLDEKQINEILLAVADAAMEHCEDILKANVEDLGRMDVANPKYDRLKLTKERLPAFQVEAYGVVLHILDPSWHVSSGDQQLCGTVYHKFQGQ